MVGWLATPVIAGLAVGVAFVLLFSFLLPILGNQQHDRVVFSGLMSGTETHQIYIVNDDGTGLTRLTEEDDLWHFEPVSSPDGSKIAYVTHNSFPNAPPDGKRVENLYVMSTDGTNKVQLADSSDGFIGRHVWSPDGIKIAYEANEDIFVVNADGKSNTTNVTNDGGTIHDFKPTWASNDKIIFESVVFGENNRSFTASSFKEVDVDTGEVRKLFDFDYNTSGSHVWSPGLNKIAFLQADDEFSPANLYIINSDGRNQTRLTTTGELLFSGELAWSPDGIKIAFHTFGGESGSIYVIDVNDSSYRNLSNSETFDSNPIWSSDGRKIAFTRISEEEAGIHIMNSDGSGQKQIAEMKPSIVNTPLDWIN